MNGFSGRLLYFLQYRRIGGNLVCGGPPRCKIGDVDDDDDIVSPPYLTSVDKLAAVGSNPVG